MSGDGAAQGAAPEPIPAVTAQEAAAIAHTAGVDERHAAFRNAPDGAPPVDGVALARLYGEPLFRMPTDL